VKAARLGAGWGLVGASLAVAAAAVAASLTLSTKSLAANARAGDVFFPTSVTFSNGGTTAGRLEALDQFTVAFSQQVSQTTLCGGWNNTVSSRTLSVTVALVDTTAVGGDYVWISAAPTASCPTGLFNLGNITLGSTGYGVGVNTWTGSTLTLTQTATSTTVNVKLGTKAGAGTLGTVASGTAATYTPHSGIRDTASRSTGTNVASSTSTVQF
jgi:hypothetical protein